MLDRLIPKMPAQRTIKDVFESLRRCYEAFYKDARNAGCLSDTSGGGVIVGHLGLDALKHSVCLGFTQSIIRFQEHCHHNLLRYKVALAFLS